jgi:hypothetical protein
LTRASHRRSSSPEPSPNTLAASLDITSSTSRSWAGRDLQDQHADGLVVDEQHCGAFAEQLSGIKAASAKLPLIATNSRTSSVGPRIPD